MKKLKLNRQTIRVLTSHEFAIVAGGVIDQGSGDAHCPTTVGYPGCESVGCPGNPSEGVCLTRNIGCTWNDCPTFQFC